jgi:hypothetical protein
VTLVACTSAMRDRRASSARDMLWHGAGGGDCCVANGAECVPDHTADFDGKCCNGLCSGDVCADVSVDGAVLLWFRQSIVDGTCASRDAHLLWRRYHVVSLLLAVQATRCFQAGGRAAIRAATTGMASRATRPRRT